MELVIGNKYQHANGICQLVSVETKSMMEGQEPELYATLQFAIPTDIVYIPLRSASLLNVCDQSLPLTRMQVPVTDADVDKYLTELLLK